MPLGHRMVQRRISRIVRRVQWAPRLQKQVDHGDGSHGCRTVQWVLAALVADAGRGGGVLVQEELAGEVEVGFGDDEVEDRL